MGFLSQLLGPKLAEPVLREYFATVAHGLNIWAEPTRKAGGLKWDTVAGLERSARFEAFQKRGASDPGLERVCFLALCSMFGVDAADFSRFIDLDAAWNAGQDWFKEFPDDEERAYYEMTERPARRYPSSRDALAIGMNEAKRILRGS
ncbi:MAG: hypothetical protein WEB06_10535 [Actinomycetota bacterium]